jgi:hypothetical protein
MATHKVRVIVPQREGFQGVYAAGKFWPSADGEQEVEVDDAQLQTLAARPGIVVLKDGKPVKASSTAPSRVNSVSLSADELAVVEEYREKRAKDPKLAQKYGTDATAALVKPTGESQEDAEARALAESASGGSNSAQAPLDHRDILLGQKTGGMVGAQGETTRGEQKPRSNEDLKPKK